MKGNVSKIVSDKGAASEQYIDATVGTALKNSKEANENAQTALDYSEEALSKIVNSETAALQAVEKVGLHKTAPVLDHPDGSVTPEKLSDEVKARISEAYDTAQTASETAIAAKATAEVAKDVADIAKSTADDAFDYSNEARGMANDADVRSAVATATAEAAEQRAISAETKADAAVASASGAVQKAETVQSDLAQHRSDTDIHTTAEEKADIEQNISTAQETAEKSLQYWKPNTLYKEGQVVYAYSDNYKCDLIIECRTTHTSSDSYDSDYSKWDYLLGVTADRAWLSQYADKAYCATYDIYGNDIYDTYAKQAGLAKKADKPTIITDTESTSYTFDFSDMYNSEMRLQAASTISIIFVDNEYAQDYISGLSFDSGETPTAIDYTDSGILNWVGTDCVTSDGLSIFQPSQNTHYDIVFYFNGVQFIGLVNGFVPATGNEAV